MLTGTVVGGVTGGILGPPGGAAGGAGQSASAYITQQAGDVVVRTLLTDIGSSVIPAIENIAAQAIITSGVGAGATVINNVISETASAVVKTTSDLGSSVSKSLTMTTTTSWGPTWAEKIVPRYGNYGGPSHGDPTFKTKPIDEMDALYRGHDEVWAHGQADLGDWNIAPQLRALHPSPLRWNPPAPNPVWAMTYRSGAQLWFNTKRSYLLWKHVIKGAILHE